MQDWAGQTYDEKSGALPMTINKKWKLFYEPIYSLRYSPKTNDEESLDSIVNEEYSLMLKDLKVHPFAGW